MCCLPDCRRVSTGSARQPTVLASTNLKKKRVFCPPCRRCAASPVMKSISIPVSQSVWPAGRKKGVACSTYTYITNHVTSFLSTLTWDSLTHDQTKGGSMRLPSRARGPHVSPPMMRMQPPSTRPRVVGSSNTMLPPGASATHKCSVGHQRTVPSSCFRASANAQCWPGGF